MYLSSRSMNSLLVVFGHINNRKHSHNGLASFSQVMYLSSRSIGQANITRDFINSLVQGGHRMPLGPVIISPHGLLPSLYR
jgi:phosphatidate phosphatase PAH1